MNKNEEESLWLYRRLYAAKREERWHPTRRIHLEPYGINTNRVDLILRWFEQHIPSDDHPRILDASCGRGVVLRRLLEEGYSAVGTEFVPEVVEELLFEGLPVARLAYSELRDFPPRSFDAVLSSDVLEHLHSEEEAIDAFNALCDISKKWVVVTVGVRGARKFPTALGLGEKGITDLHFVKRKPKWWRSLFETRLDIVQAENTIQSYYAIGRLKEDR